MARPRCECEIEDDELSLRVAIGDPDGLDVAALLPGIEAAVEAALDLWRDGQRAALGYRDEAGAAYHRRLGRLTDGNREGRPRR